MVNRWLPLLCVFAASCLWPRDARELSSDTDTDTDTESDLQEDRFDQGTHALDLLFVIDSSCSMQEKIDRLSLFVNEMFIELHAGPVDYHVGATNTNMDDPQFQGHLHEVDGLLWVQRDTVDAGLIAADMVTYPLDSQQNEMGFDAAHTAIEVLGNSDNAGFYRPEANFAVVVLSDENDYSQVMNASTFTTWIAGLKEAPYAVSFHSIVGDDLGGTTCSTAVEAGTDYLQVTSNVGGIFGSVCNEDYGPTVTLLTRHALGLADRFVLTLVPQPDTIEVLAETDDGDLVYQRGTEWLYESDGNQVAFTQAPPPVGSTVVITYEVAR